MNATTPEKETILLVDDEPAVRHLVDSILESHGYRILQAENGKQALALAEDHRGPIHLLVSDVMMPELDGPSLAEQLRTVRPEVRVIFMSGYAAGLLILDGGWAFVQKPFLPSALIKIIRDTLALLPKPVLGSL